MADPEPQTSTPKPAPAPLPVLRTALEGGEILDRLDKASRRGKMPGFHRQTPDRPGLFWLEVFGKFFDRRLTARLEPAPEGDQRLIRFSMRSKRWPIWVFWVVVAITIWPGVVLTDSLLATYFSWYPREFWVTCVWYLPLAIVPVPWMWKAAWGQSSAIADAEARQLIAKVAQHLGASVQGE